MVKECTLVEIRLFGIVIHIEQAFRQLEHVIGIARFGSFAFLDIFFVVVERRKMFRNAVAANRDAAIVHNSIPEIFRALHIGFVVREFCNARKAHDLRDLRICMYVREVVIPGRHRIQKPLVSPAFGLVQVLLFLGQRISVGINFSHATVFRAEHRFHLRIVESSRNRESPVAQCEKHVLRLFVTRIDIGIAQARIELVDIVPRHPITILGTRITVLELEPHRFAVRHAADIALEIRFLGILVLNRLELAQHVFQAFFHQFVATGRIVHRQGAQVMAQHMAIKTRPVRKLGCFRLHARFFVERSDQFVRIVAE